MATTGVRRDVEETRADIEATFGFVPGWLDLTDEDLTNEWPTMKRHMLEETAIPAKYKELIGLAVAANIKCPYCQHFHREAAKMHGATEEELQEVAFLAGHTPRYSSMIHAMDYDIETFREEFARIAEHFEQHME
jgi:AhpD family alkylhydroperoxidase